jgi:hypothetical protein
MSITYAYAADISKAERDEAGDLIVYGKATGPDLDLDEQVCDPKWLKGAMPGWFEWANVREMHQPIAAGVGIELAAEGDDWWLKSKVIDDRTAKKIESEALKGYSIGIKNAKVVKDATAPGGRIVGGTIVEISYVDRPCNPTAKMAICKMAGDRLEPTDAPEEPAPVDEAKTADPDLVKRGTDLTAEVRSLVPDLDKGAPAQDIADAQAAIAAVARLIVSEAEGLAGGRLEEAYQISTLLEAVCALRWFIAAEQSEAVDVDVMLDAQPDTTKAAPEPEPAPETPDATPAPENTTELVKAAVAEALRPLEERQKALEADLAKALAQPAPGGPVLTRTAAQAAQARVTDAATLNAQADEYLSKAAATDDATLARGYRDRAAQLRERAGA